MAFDSKRQALTKIDAKLSGRSSTGHAKQGSIDTILSTLFERIMTDLDINTYKWNQLMVRFINDPRKCIPTNTKEQSSARGNLQKELLKPRMSWKVFCKGISFLSIKKFKLTIEAYHENGKTTNHSIMINFGDHPPEDLNASSEEAYHDDGKITNHSTMINPGDHPPRNLNASSK